MPRAAIRVSNVAPADVEASAHFDGLWLQSRLEAGQSREWAERTLREGVTRRALARTDVRVYLATADETAVGYAVVMDGPLSGLAEDPVAWIDQMYVAVPRRRAGVARALLARVAHDAASRGASQVISCVPTQAKDLNRYFARLGFAPAITERAITPAALLRHLADADSSAAMAVVRRRRSLRARARARVQAAPGGS